MRLIILLATLLASTTSMASRGDIIVNHKVYGKNHNVAVFHYKICSVDEVNCFNTLADSLGPASDRSISGGNRDNQKLIITDISVYSGSKLIAQTDQPCEARFEKDNERRITITSGDRGVSCHDSTGTWPGSPV